MIYIIAITLLALSHLIAHRGTNGCRLSYRVEKIVVFFAAVWSFVAIFELCKFVISLSAHNEGALSEHILNMIVYPVGFIIFLLVIFVGLPKPIQENKLA
ncbi:hypothetical protein HW115_19095 [Verrucomicrobiaceae bacterium N1E253]|uniref:Uncharacterized protein n=1 Tax=Oceaniferula marina TaxID=2748318 RepID=A0A851GJN6_9BACT|nr:hypothetical protein [Oceaniferula marina]NWK57733.1 hypothetical protein [Oceaniferula marina]